MLLGTITPKHLCRYGKIICLYFVW